MNNLCYKNSVIHNARKILRKFRRKFPSVQFLWKHNSVSCPSSKNNWRACLLPYTCCKTKRQ